jgi:hypothetical protein
MMKRGGDKPSGGDGKIVARPRVDQEIVAQIYGLVTQLRVVTKVIQDNCSDAKFSINFNLHEREDELS